MSHRSLALSAGAARLFTGCSATSDAPAPSFELSGSTVAPVSPPANPLPTGSEPVTLNLADLTADFDHSYCR